ncbi:MAG: CinA family nicotinamide mononucleotide deamidase-related protein [Deinococcota bacterium]
MIAEFISIGTELLLGEIVDTNSAWVASDLAERGVTVYRSTRIGDNLERIQTVLREALSRADVVITCGGLGPTDDDMTREAIAALLSETPKVDSELEATLRARFAKFSRHMPEQNLKQAWLIPSAESLPNPNGTAPGWFVRLSGGNGAEDKVIITLPGPPRELKAMWLEQAVPRLQLPKSAFYIKILKTTNIGESTAAEKLGTWTRSANPSVATYAKKDGVHVRVAAKADTVDAAKHAAVTAEQEVRDALQGFVWGEDADEFGEVVTQKLAAKGKTLASLETVSGGMLADSLSTPAAEAAFLGGMVAHNPQSLRAFSIAENLLTVNSEDATSYEALAEAMAKVAAKQFGADYGLAICGHWQAHSQSRGQTRDASAQDASPQDNIVAVGSFDGQTHLSRSFKLPSSERDWLRERATYRALALLLFEVVKG